MLSIIQNDLEVPLGTFAEYLAVARVPYTLIRSYRGEPLPSAGKASAIMVLGGAMGVHDTDQHPFLVKVKVLIRECLDKNLPFLGICLGGQLLADALGGQVTSGSPWGEKGTMTVRLLPAGQHDPLLAGLPEEFMTFQWHNDSFAIPAGACLLASSDRCPNQAFRFGECAWGVQFHPEVDRSIVDCWARWSAETAPEAEEYLAAFLEHEDMYRGASRRLLENFLHCARLL